VLARIGAATALMAGAVIAVSHLVPGGHGFGLAGRVALAMAAGLVTYLGVARALGVEEVDSLVGQLRRRPA